MWGFAIFILQHSSRSSFGRSCGCPNIVLLNNSKANEQFWNRSETDRIEPKPTRISSKSIQNTVESIRCSSWYNIVECGITIWYEFVASRFMLEWDSCIMIICSVRTPRHPRVRCWLWMKPLRHSIDCLDIGCDIGALIWCRSCAWQKTRNCRYSTNCRSMHWHRFQGAESIVGCILPIPQYATTWHLFVQPCNNLSWLR